jgi:tripartite-type tricarboxylate transporter receptor subunit TctC
VVGYSAGGGVDAVARLLGVRLSAVLGQQVLVENRTGATGLIAADLVAKAPPDGYTLMMGDSALLIAKLLQPKMGIDPLTSFKPVAGAFISPLMIVTGNDFPAKTPAELVTLLKAHPARYSFATSGVGTVQHLGFEMLKQSTGTFVVHVPYRGAAQIVPDVIGGQVPIGVVSATAAMAQAKAGKLRALALMNTAKLEGAEGVAPLADALPGFDVAPRIFVLAPAGTPRSGRNHAGGVPCSANVPRPTASSFISLRKAPRQRDRCSEWSLIDEHDSRASCAQGIGCSPQRNKGGAKRGTFAEGSTRCPVHAP